MYRTPWKRRILYYVVSLAGVCADTGLMAATPHGDVAIGMLEELLSRLNVAFCDQTLWRSYQCPAYEAVRERLWITLANEYFCGGLSPTQWNTGIEDVGVGGEDVSVPVRSMPIQEQFDYILNACVTNGVVSAASAASAASSASWRGGIDDVLSVLQRVSVTFLQQSSVNSRVDINAVIAANDAKAQRTSTTPTDDTASLHPPYYASLAPTWSGTRAPALVTWQPGEDADDVLRSVGDDGTFPGVSFINASTLLSFEVRFFLCACVVSKSSTHRPTRDEKPLAKTLTRRG